MIDIYADSADLKSICEMKKNPLVKGFTTNPTLMKQSGVIDYESFCKSALEIVGDLPISFEVFSDEFDDMERQARKIASWGKNVNVKIPVTNTQGKSCTRLIKKLSDDGIVCNVTAVFTREQVASIVAALNPKCKAIISIFAGRVADTGVDPFTLMHAAHMLRSEKIKILWASAREALNVKQAEMAGCDIITLSPDLLKKASFFGKNLNTFSLETVKMFYNDAQASGYSL